MDRSLFVFVFALRRLERVSTSLDGRYVACGLLCRPAQYFARTPDLEMVAAMDPQRSAGVLALHDKLLELASDVPLLGTHADGDLARNGLDRTGPLGVLLRILDRLALQSVLDWLWVPNRLDPVVVLVSRPTAPQACVCHTRGLSVHAASCLHELLRIDLVYACHDA